MSGARPIPITLYTKPGCHLCEDAADLLESLSTQWPLQIDAIDITSDLDLHRRWWDKIPVVMIDQITLHAPIEQRDLEAALRAAER